jgi:hypothetical protein
MVRHEQNKDRAEGAMRSSNASELFRRSIQLLLLCAAFASASAQDTLGVHAQLAGHAYRDDKIEVEAPTNWTISIETETTRGSQQLTFAKGAILRKGKYILRLCSSCGQVSGALGGRFSEISSMVQPWYRDEEQGLQCGKQEISKTSSLLDRVDFWYTRDPAHPTNPAIGDCHEPATSATVWYGSYFTQLCSEAFTEQDGCGGYFLTGLTSQNYAGLSEMAFALTYDTTNPNQLPHKADPQLTRILQEASGIVASVRYRGKP